MRWIPIATTSLLCPPSLQKFVIMSKLYSSWITICESLDELRPDRTMNMGQCFNWKACGNLCWAGILGSEPVLIRQSGDYTQYLSLVRDSKQFDRCGTERNLRSYFQLDVNLRHLYSSWSSGCERMHIVTKCLQGVRVVRQDPWECLISFICSSNNNISRITQMLEKLRRRYGKHVCTVCTYKISDSCVSKTMSEGCTIPDMIAHHQHQIHDASDPTQNVWKVFYPGESICETYLVDQFELYSFPSVSALAGASEDDLRALGMGYRAKFILASAQLVQSKCQEIVDNNKRGRCNQPLDYSPKNCFGEPWFNYLRRIAEQARRDDYIKPEHRHSPDGIIGDQLLIHTMRDSMERLRVERIAAAQLQVQQMLLEFPGVGRKVADCVALFSLDQTTAIPVDTHVWSIVLRDYAPHFYQQCAQCKRKGHSSNTSSVAVKTESVDIVVKSEGANINENSRTDTVVSMKSSVMPKKRKITESSKPLCEIEVSTSLTPVKDAEPKSLTPAVYEAVGQVFRDRFGEHAGWAHSVLFAAELPAFRIFLPQGLQNEMIDFAAEQRSAKKILRDEKSAQKQAKSKSSEVRDEVAGVSLIDKFTSEK